jgi:hypothetical protein
MVPRASEGDVSRIPNDQGAGEVTQHSDDSIRLTKRSMKTQNESYLVLSTQKNFSKHAQFQRICQQEKGILRDRPDGNGRRVVCGWRSGSLG